MPHLMEKVLMVIFRFFSIVEDKYLAIHRALPFAATDEIKLGYSTTIAGSFTIKIDQTMHFFRSKCFSKINL
jgi:hypothetical protein